MNEKVKGYVEMPAIKWGPTKILPNSTTKMQTGTNGRGDLVTVSWLGDGYGWRAFLGAGEIQKGILTQAQARLVCEEALRAEYAARIGG